MVYDYHNLWELSKARDFLSERGHTVFTPVPLVTEEWYKENNTMENFLEMKPVWTMRHFKRIEQSDAVLIMNHEKKGISGYFGSNTLMELTVAFYLGKEIFFLHEVMDNHPHFEEVNGIKSTCLFGDLNQLV